MYLQANAMKGYSTACCLTVYAPIISPSLHTNPISTLYGAAAVGMRATVFKMAEICPPFLRLYLNEFPHPHCLNLGDTP